MIIELANVGTVPKMIELTFEPTEIDLAGESVTLTGNVVFSGEAERESAKTTVKGTVAVDAKLDCTRCLEPVAKHLDFQFRDIFVDSAMEDTRTEAEIAAEQLDESLVENGRIDMAEVVREQILLALPEQIFCREDCRGLCPKCGENLNLIDCKCADDDIDPRWAALKSLK
ncbi:DUF177 domain-containing protein [soil metagenome]